MGKSKDLSLFDVLEETTSSKLQSEFVRLEKMTDSECSLSLNYSFSTSPFGKLLMASTSKGLCYMVFYENEEEAIQEFKVRFPRSTYKQYADEFHVKAKSIFEETGEKLETINLHIRGTDFQFQVWKELLKIPKGKLSTYGEIAQQIGKPKASRAVGTAIGSNPVAFIVPCHRVVQKSGKLGGYMWGTDRKKEIIAWEAGRK